MSLILIGINHKTAAVKVRERFSFTKKRIDECLTELRDSVSVRGAVILSTCNRTEIYIHINEQYFNIQTINSFITDIFHAQESEIERYFYILEDVDVIRHIFRVACGLDSQILGEIQILTQVRLAWTMAKDMGMTSNKLDTVFKNAQEIGRKVRLETKISEGNISIGSVAINMLESKFRDLQGHSVLIIGAGKIGTLMSKYLKEEKIKGIFVASRTYLRAVELAINCGGKAVDFSRLEEELREVDIVISSTSSPHIILKKEMVIKVMEDRKRPLFIMDLALPRDVEPNVRDIEDVSLCDLDDLKSVVEDNHKKRREEAVLAEKIIQQELDKKICFPIGSFKLPF